MIIFISQLTSGYLTVCELENAPCLEEKHDDLPIKNDDFP